MSGVLPVLEYKDERGSVHTLGQTLPFKVTPGTVEYNLCGVNVLLQGSYGGIVSAVRARSKEAAETLFAVLDARKGSAL